MSYATSDYGANERTNAIMNERARQQETAANRIAFAVRKRRKSMGITQQVLAQRAGCGLVFVYNIEHGKPSLRFDKLLDVLDVLGLELVVQADERDSPSVAPRCPSDV